MRSSLLLIILFSLLPLTASAAAPDFSLPGQNGKLIKLSKYKGQVVYLDFWASWCKPCQKSFPWMNRMQKQYGPYGLTVIAVNLDQNTKAAKKFLRHTPAQFTVAYDPNGKVANHYQLKGMPSSYLIDRHGKIVANHIGFLNKHRDKVEAQIKKTLTKR